MADAPSEWGAINATVDGVLVADPADALGLVDGVTASLSGSTSVGDIVGLADLANGVLSAPSNPHAPSEWGTVNATVGGEGGASLGDPVGLIDSVTATLSGDGPRTPSEWGTVNATVDGPRVVGATINDPVGILDTDRDQVIEFDYVEDNAVSIADSVTTSSSSDLAKLVEDSLGLSDVAVATLNIVRDATLADPVGLTDFASATMTGEGDAAVADPVAIADEITVVMQRVVTVDDFLDIIDQAIAVLDGPPVTEVEDAVAIGDDVLVQWERFINIDDLARVTDFATTDAVEPTAWLYPLRLGISAAPRGRWACKDCVMETIKQGDIRDLDFYVTNADGTPTDLSGTTVTLLARRVQGDVVELATTVTDPTSGVITHMLDGTLSPGTYYLVVVLDRDGERVTAPTAGMACLKVEPTLEMSTP